MLAWLSRLLRQQPCPGWGDNSCYKCGRAVQPCVPFDGDQGSISYVSTGVLGQAGFHCGACGISFCSRCSGSKSVGSESYRVQPGHLSIPCPRCGRMVASPLVRESAWHSRA